MTSLFVDNSMVPIPLKRRKCEDNEGKKVGTIKLRFKENNFGANKRITNGVTPCSTLEIETLVEAVTEIRDKCWSEPI